MKWLGMTFLLFLSAISAALAEPSPSVGELTLSVPRDFPTSEDAEQIFGVYPGDGDVPDPFGFQAQADLYLSPNELLGLCYQIDHKYVNSVFASISAQINSFLVEGIRRVPLSPAFDLSLTARAGLDFLVGFEYDETNAFMGENFINGTGFAGEVGLGLAFKLNNDFALGVEGGYEYAPLPLSMTIPSGFLKTSGTQVLNANGTNAIVDFSGWYINFISLRITFHQSGPDKDDAADSSKGDK